MGLALQAGAVFGGGDVQHAAHALRQGLAAQVGHAVLGDDQAGVGTRRADRAGQLRDDAARALGGCWQRHDRQAAAAARGAAQEIHRAAHRADIDAGGHFGIDLAGQVDLDGGVDRGQLVDAGEHFGVVGIGGLAQLQLRIAVGPAPQPLAAHQDAADANAGIDALACIGQHTGFGQHGDAVADRAAVQPQVAAVMQRGHHGLGQVADAHLQGRAVFHPAGDVAGDGLFGRAGSAAFQADGRVARVDLQVDLVGGEITAAVGPRHLGVHFGNDHAGPVERGGQVFMHQAQAMTALFVSGRDLYQHHVGVQRAVPDQPWQVRIMARHDVQHAGTGQPAVRPAGGIAEEVDDVGLLRLQRVRLADADEYAEAPVPRDGVAVCHQRARQRQRLGGGLSPPEVVAGADQGLQSGGQVVHVGGETLARHTAGISRPVPDSPEHVAKAAFALFDNANGRLWRLRNWRTAARGAACPDLSRVEGALSESLIVPPAERRDHGGYHAAWPIRRGRHLPIAKTDRHRHRPTASQRHDRTDPIEQFPRNPRCHPGAVRGVPRRVLPQGR
ncbi:hypothetical protein CBM2589_A90106 [Cupriavidus taiwanensis]|uniref:Uncharacterized protein n=1 Tax=Cupriavidus taiwanensis TaxID=164546 RepID=A0A375CEE7_9BURK|nr:hypothetical protein CBM2589_A90106 [Cupriavidus taiwanensis]